MIIDRADLEIRLTETIRRIARQRGMNGTELVVRLNEHLPPECQIKKTRWWNWCSPKYRQQRTARGSHAGRGAVPIYLVVAACIALDSTEPAECLLEGTGLPWIGSVDGAWIRGKGTAAPRIDE